MNLNPLEEMSDDEIKRKYKEYELEYISRVRLKNAKA